MITHLFARPETESQHEAAHRRPDDLEHYVQHCQGKRREARAERRDGDERVDVPSGDRRRGKDEERQDDGGADGGDYNGEDYAKASRAVRRELKRGIITTSSISCNLPRVVVKSDCEISRDENVKTHS